MGDSAHGAHIWSSPLLINDKLYIGLASHNDTPCVRGAVFALDPKDGHSIIIGGVLLVAQDNKVIGYEPGTGQILWQAEYQGQVWGGVSVSRGFVVVGTVSGKLYGYSLKSPSIEAPERI